ncbi:hypothetical protein GCM10022251_67760 [Phytohabitans flavus]
MALNDAVADGLTCTNPAALVKLRLARPLVWTDREWTGGGTPARSPAR